MSFSEYVNHSRLLYARELLAQPDNRNTMETSPKEFCKLTQE